MKGEDGVSSLTIGPQIRASIATTSMLMAYPPSIRQSGCQRIKHERLELMVVPAADLMDVKNVPPVLSRP
jgi:hypothetical protein